MKVLVCGGRNFTNAAYVWMALDRFHASTLITEMITGGATGADYIANDWAKTKPIKRYVSRVSKADWARLGKAAGPSRNAHMLEWKPDIVIAFAGGTGTADMVRQSQAAGVRVIRIP